MRMHSLLAMTAALAGGITFSAPAQAQQVQTRECSSWQFKPAQCAVERGARDLRLVRRIGGDCVPRRDWGLRRATIYVENGCRAVFQYSVGYGDDGNGGGYPGGYPGGGQAVRCESIRYQPARCALNTAGGVALRSVIGRSNCIQGQTWGWDRRGVWVNGGCRADFIALNNSGGGYPGGPGGGYPGGPGGGYPGGPGSGYPGGPGAGYPDDDRVVVECSSWQYRPARCVVPVGRGVRIVKVLGGECIEGRTWGWDGSGIWVNSGCRGRFRTL